MRYYIDEKMDYGFNDLKQYVLEIKDFTREALLDEMLAQRKRLYPGDYYNYEWVNEWKENYNSETDIDLITRAVEDHEYVFQDDDEHKWNLQVVQNIIDGIPVYNRWTNEKYV